MFRQLFSRHSARLLPIFCLPLVPALALPAAAQEANTGRFTTAEEVRPVLDITRTSWVAIGEYDGNDWLYVTQVMSWRCGLEEMRVSVNDAPAEIWPLIDCHVETNAPNAIHSDDPTPARRFPLDHVQKVRVELTLDDGTTMAQAFERKGVKIN